MELKTIIDLKIYNLLQYQNTLKYITTINHTALKPAHEPIVVARKPLSEKSVAENVLKWKTGGINIDDSRIGTTDKEQYEKNCNRTNVKSHWGNSNSESNVEANINGRWPANIMFDEDAAEVLDKQSGISKSTPSEWKNDFGIYHKDGRETKEVKGIKKGGHNDKGGASRFFYVAKANKKDRNSEGVINNTHATVKPTQLMEYLIKLVTPVNGTVLDPFMGSGSTGKAAVRNGYDFIGIEREEEYIKIAQARINYGN